MRQLWTGEEVNFQGKHFQLEGEHIGIRPYQDGGPPIWIGAGAEKSVQRAARIGDAWFAPGNSPKPNWLQTAMGLARHRSSPRTARSRDSREYPIVLQALLRRDDRGGAGAGQGVRPGLLLRLLGVLAGCPGSAPRSTTCGTTSS